MNPFSVRRTDQGGAGEARLLPVPGRPPGRRGLQLRRTTGTQGKFHYVFQSICLAILITQQSIRNRTLSAVGTPF